MRDLPSPPALYVGAVIALGAALLVWLGPRATFHDPVLFGVLLLASALTSAFKVGLPLDRGGSTMSVSYAVDFASLLLLGPHETMLVAVTSAWSQCTFRMKTKNPLHRTLFSMACLAITVQAAGFAYGMLGGVPGTLATTVAGVARPLVGAATIYFVFNTCSIAIAIALDDAPAAASRSGTRTSCGARRATSSAPARPPSATWAVMTSGIWLALLAIAPLYLTYRTYKVYLGRIDDERRHVEEMADLHLATIEALALAIDAKDQTAQSHIRRVQVYATEPGPPPRHVRQRDPGRQDRGAAARHRQARRARAHPVEAGPADAGRVPEDPHPSAGRRRDHQRRARSRTRWRR